MGVEPTPDAWKAPVLPLNYTHVTWKIYALPKTGTTTYPVIAFLT